MPVAITPSRYRGDVTNGTSSPPGSVAGRSSHSVASSTTSSLRPVTRLALEGKVKQGQDSVSMRMYLRLAIPLDSAVPGSTVQLFPEENLKLLNSLVHPLDSTSAPYQFSSKTAPLLQNAAHALNLPQRLTQSYLSLFPLSHSQNPPYIGASSRTSSNSIHPPLLDEKYTGHILVSGYNVSYVLPKEFPPRSVGSSSENRSSTSQSSTHRRRSSFSGRGAYQFVAAIDMLVPLRMKPPRAPYLLCIPVPQCLNNNVKLRIFSRAPTSGSYASLSSMEDEPNSWDLTSDPYVTRNASVHARSSSYASSQYADDESSDSSMSGFAEGTGLLGTFQSTDQLRIRWAAPLRAGNVNQSRRRVGVTEVKGDMTCTVLGRTVTSDDQEAVLMQLDYKTTCKEIWYAGVATLLGMDISLDTNACELSWPAGAEPRWTVTGGAGFTGWDAGEATSSKHSNAHEPSTIPVSQIMHPRNRIDSASSSNSLLRTPLTTPSIPDYSFESGTSTPIGSMASSVGSHGLFSASEAGHPSIRSSPANLLPDACDPASPLTVHINMNEVIGRSNRMPFSLHISGTVVVKPKFPSTTNALDDAEAAVPVVGLPRFRLLAAEKEAVQTVIKNDTQSALIEVFTLTGDLKDAQTRKTVLQLGSITRCGTEGGRIALRSINPPTFSRMDTEQNSYDETLGATATPSRPGTPADSLRRSFSRSALGRSRMSQSGYRTDDEGPQTIPHVRVTATLLDRPSDEFLDEYIISATFSAPSEADLHPLEFGMARPVVEDPDKAPVLTISDVVASIDGISAPIDLVQTKDSSGLGIQGLASDFDETTRRDWMNWIRLRTTCPPGSTIVASYKVSVQGSTRGKGRKKASNDGRDVVLLTPSFPLRISRLDVETEHSMPHLISATNMRVQRQIAHGWRLTHFRAEDLFRPNISVRLGPMASSRPISYPAVALKRLLLLLPTICCLLLADKMWRLQQQIQHLQSQHAGPTTSASGAETIISTSTIYITASAPVSTSPTLVPTPDPLPLAVEPTPVPTDAATARPPPSDSIPATTQTVILADLPTLAPPPAPAAAPTLEQAVARPLSEYQLFQLLRKVHMPKSEDVTQAVWTGVRQVWWWCQVAFHYPLPPPP